ncbi:hypothetical protein [Saccharopolyspora taberi]|uniref:Secreted protein n=1 Tax=Saccharopolyspora taberi TaxID=60895 RepID=A0ABN3VEP8_9PSEU
MMGRAVSAFALVGLALVGAAATAGAEGAADGSVPGLLCAERGGTVVPDGNGQWCVGGEFDGRPVSGVED